MDIFISFDRAIQKLSNDYSQNMQISRKLGIELKFYRYECRKLCVLFPGSVNNSFQIVHPCIGVCGEQCLDICVICNPERLDEIKEIFFGTEDEEDARFVKLADCGHIFEAKVSFYA